MCCTQAVVLRMGHASYDVIRMHHTLDDDARRVWYWLTSSGHITLLLMSSEHVMLSVWTALILATRLPEPIVTTMLIFFF